MKRAQKSYPQDMKIKFTIIKIPYSDIYYLPPDLPSPTFGWEEYVPNSMKWSPTKGLSRPFPRFLRPKS